MKSPAQLPPARRRRLALLLITALVTVSAALPAAAAVSVYPLSEVRPGLAAEAHTVFQGTQVETFRLEVVGVIRRGAAEGSLILARATEPRVEHTGIVAGMSGSPVYAADGRLLGALAYAWGFSKDPICGITPIEEMLPVWQLPTTAAASEFQAGAGEAPLPDGAASHEDAGRGGAGGAMPELRTPLAAAGLAPEALRLLAPWAEQHGFLLAPGGLAATGAAAPAAGTAAAADGSHTLAPGDAVSVDLLRGDANLSAIGTVTAVDGDRVLAFGHPLFMNGATRLPISRAEIATIIPSLESSFKIGIATTPVGTLLQDRRTAIAGRLGAVPAMLPIAVRVRTPGLADMTYHYDAAKHRQLMPLLVGAAAINSMVARVGMPVESTWRWRLAAVLHIAGRAAPRRFEIADMAPGDNFPVFGMLSTTVGALLNNDWQPVDLERLDLDLDMTPQVEEARVVAARLERPRVRPGETVRVEVDLAAHRGPTRTARLEYQVPDDTGERVLTLFVGGGQALARYDATMAPGRYRANSLDEMLRRLTESPRASRLYLAVYETAPEASVRGRDYPNLPPSAQRLLSLPDAADATAAWGRATLLGSASLSFDQVVSGGTTLKVQVTPRAAAAGPSELDRTPAVAPDDDSEGPNE